MKYFTITELIYSPTALRLGIKNKPNEEAVKNLNHLVDCVLDRLREWWGSAIIVTSGYRCNALNEAVGGAEYSYHRLGMAADIRPQKGSLADLYALIHKKFVYGELGLTECYMDEKKGYIHIAFDISGFSTWPFITIDN